MPNYDDLRRQCRTLESRLDAKLTSYSRLAANIGRSDDVEASGSNDRWRDMEEEIDGLLEKVRAQSSRRKPPAYVRAQLNEMNDHLSTLLNDPESPPSQSMTRTIQRHREVLSDYERDYTRTKVREMFPSVLRLMKRGACRQTRRRL